MTLYYLNLKLSGAYIGHSSHFAGPPCFPHGLKGIFVAGGAQVGKNCVIFQNVTIGSNPLPDSKTVGAPTIGNNVIIGAGAAIVGNVTVGDNCRIGANTTVSKNIPANCVVVSAASRVIQKTSLTNRYYKWSPNGPRYYDDGEWKPETDPDIIAQLEGKL